MTDDEPMTRWMSCVVASALLLAATAGLAEGPAQARVRGTIEATDGRY
jgi:Tfp pilus assembly protein PilN